MEIRSKELQRQRKEDERQASGRKLITSKNEEIAEEDVQRLQEFQGRR